MPKQVWDLAVDVMNLFEKAKLKDQKLRSAMATTKPDFKQQYLAPIRCLNSEDQCFLLLRCKNGHLSLKELKKEVLKMYVLKKGFIKLTNCKNWEDALSQFPQFACETQLRKFISFDMSKDFPQLFTDFPQLFTDFCKCVKSSEQHARSDDEQEIGCAVKSDGVVAFAITAKLSEINGHTISSIYSKFSGADLIFLSIKQVYHVGVLVCRPIILYW